MKNYLLQREQDESQQNQKYDICLILTDGAVTDIEDTIDTIIEISDLAISIIIVGIGKSNFKAMRRLDSDHERLYSNKFKR